MDELSYNTEHYRDPTVFLALKHVLKEEKEKRVLQEMDKQKEKSKSELNQKDKTEDEE